MNATAADHAFMSRALQLAARALYTTDPNPRVGSVVVQDGEVVGEGFHVRAGEAHAEVLAMRAAGDRVAGSTVYVTLEPCSHQGRTGPCADALIAAKPARVVVAMQDPNPKVSGRGIARLREAGIAVDVGVLEADARALNPGFISRMQHGVPFVRVKLAMSLDGRTAMAGGESQWITGSAAREDVQRLRARSGAVVTGIGTVLADNPALTVRPEEWRLGRYDHPWVRQPMRIVLDRDLRIAVEAAVLKPGGGEALVVTEDRVLASPAGSRRADALRALGAEVIGLPAGEEGIDLRALLVELGLREVNELLVEAGARLAGSFVTAGLTGELVVYQAPALMGSTARPLLDIPIEAMAGKIPLVLTDVRMVGPDIRMTARISTAL